MKYIVAFLMVLAFGLTADAQTRYHRPQHPHHHNHHHNHVAFVHRPTVVLYGNYAQYQQYNFALVGYTNLAALRQSCGLYGFQIVQVNQFNNYAIVRLPVSYQWNTIVTFSRLNHVRFVEPSFRRY